AILALGLHVVVGCEQETSCSARRIAHSLADLRINAFDDGLNHGPRREVLARTGLYLCRIALQQTLIDLALDVDLETDPGSLPMNQAHHALQLGRILQLVLRLSEVRADKPLLTSQGLQGMAILQLQCIAVLVCQLRPTPLRRDRRGLP